MVGRTPEYLGKKIGAREIKFASLYFLTMPTLVLVGTGVAMALPGERAAMLNTGAHGLSEVLYAFTSATNNNGSAFAGISVNTTWYNTALGLAMLLGRFLPIVFVLGLAGSLARQQTGTGLGRHPADPPAAVRRHARRRHRDPRRADLPARPRARPAGRGSALRPRRKTVDGCRDCGTAGSGDAAPGRRAGCWIPKQLWKSTPDALRKLDPRTLWRNPVMFIVEIGSVFTTVLAIANPTRVRLADHDLAVADRGVRQPRRGGRRGPGQGSGRRRCAGPRQDTMARRLFDWTPGGHVAEGAAGARPAAAARRHRRGRGRADRSRATATWSRASPASTSRPSPASPRR